MARDVGRWLGIAGGVSVAAAASAVAYGRFGIGRDAPLPPALDAERRVVDSPAGRLSYYVAGSGPALLLVHSINAAASAYEVGPLFERFRQTHRVYAPDLPGFGFSERSQRDYDAGTYVQAIAAMADELRAETGESRIVALALSLSGEFLARFADEHPEALAGIVLVTPTGFETGSRARRGRRASMEVPGLLPALRVPLWREGLYNLLVTRRSMRFFLEQTWGSKDIDERFLDYGYLSAHQPGAEHAPYCFVSGRLFSRDIRDVYDRLTVPVFLLHGTRGQFSDFAEVGAVRGRANWTVQAMPTGALPHFERLDETENRIRDFLAAIGDADQGSSSGPRSPSP
ncbi:MAG: alpha/beta hydrolase [Methylobacteriaceae bacterium]|nr:alpha/beta hydrolase [Methylobacteriaceae bacterium]